MLAAADADSNPGSQSKQTEVALCAGLSCWWQCPSYFSLHAEAERRRHQPVQEGGFLQLVAQPQTAPPGPLAGSGQPHTVAQAFRWARILRRMPAVRLARTTSLPAALVAAGWPRPRQRSAGDNRPGIPASRLTEPLRLAQAARRQEAPSHASAGSPGSRRFCEPRCSNRGLISAHRGFPFPPGKGLREGRS